MTEDLAFPGELEQEEPVPVSAAPLRLAPSCAYQRPHRDADGFCSWIITQPLVSL